MYLRLIAFFVSSVCLCDGGAEKYVPLTEIKTDGLFTYTKVHPPFFDSLEPHIQKRESPVDERLIEDNKYQIPVTVSDEVQTPKPEKTRRRKLRRQGSKNVTQSTQNIIKNTTPLPSTTVSPSKTSTNFPKRPEEDSKRIAFQRRSRTHSPVVKILDAQNFVYAHSGNFHYSYDTADGTKISSEGKLIKNEKNEGTGEAVIGSVSYTDDEGNDYSLSYTADENGYRPVGAHLPTPPPIPPEIARALEILATKKPDVATDYY